MRSNAWATSACAAARLPCLKELMSCSGGWAYEVEPTAPMAAPRNTRLIARRFILHPLLVNDWIGTASLSPRHQSSLALLVAQAHAFLHPCWAPCRIALRFDQKASARGPHHQRAG